MAIYTSENLKKFVLFELKLDKGVEVVPSTRISKEKTICKFPDPSALPGKNWINYEILYVSTYGKLILCSKSC